MKGSGARNALKIWIGGEWGDRRQVRGVRTSSSEKDRHRFYSTRPNPAYYVVDIDRPYTWTSSFIQMSSESMYSPLRPRQGCMPEPQRSLGDQNRGRKG